MDMVVWEVWAQIAHLDLTLMAQHVLWPQPFLVVQVLGMELHVFQLFKETVQQDLIGMVQNVFQQALQHAQLDQLELTVIVYLPLKWDVHEELGMEMLVLH